MVGNGSRTRPESAPRAAEGQLKAELIYTLGDEMISLLEKMALKAALKLVVRENGLCKVHSMGLCCVLRVAGLGVLQDRHRSSGCCPQPCWTVTARLKDREGDER